MNAADFHKNRLFAETPSGRIAYVEQGAGPATLFLHGVPLNGFHWRYVIEGVSDIRRCYALDLMGLGYTEIKPEQDVSFTAQAHMVAQFMDATGLQQVDLVGNDSGGAIAQIFAANYPERLRTLTLTNCDVHDKWPPEAILPTVEAARKGTLANAMRLMLENGDLARSTNALGVAYANPDALTDEAIKVYAEPVTASEERIANFHRYWLSFDPSETVAIEPQLSKLSVPTLIVWGLADIFFSVESAHWLADTIPGVVETIELPDAKLFFPEDQPAALIEPLRRFWTSTSGD